MAARCLGVISQVSTQDVMSFTVEKTLPLLRASDSDTCRLGAAEAVASILNPKACWVIMHEPGTVARSVACPLCKQRSGDPEK